MLLLVTMKKLNSKNIFEEKYLKIPTRTIEKSEPQLIRSCKTYCEWLGILGKMRQPLVFLSPNSNSAKSLIHNGPLAGLIHSILGNCSPGNRQKCENNRMMLFSILEIRKEFVKSQFFDDSYSSALVIRVLSGFSIGNES